MIKSDSHDSGNDYHSQSERLIRNDTLSQARRARRQSRTISATSGDETKRDVPEVHATREESRRQRKSSPNRPRLPPLDNPTTVTIEDETKSKREKKTFKTRKGEDMEMTVRKANNNDQRRRRRTKSKEGNADSETPVDHGKDHVLGIVVHRTDRLCTDLRLRHPFVRVHLVDMNTRSYVLKTNPNRLTLRYQIPNEKPADHITGFSTQAYDFNANHSTIPAWEEMLIVDEEYSHFATVKQSNVCIFFEILDSFNNQQNTNDVSNTFPVAWAFLKIIGARETLNTERITRLQLWQPIPLHRSPSALTPDVVMWHGQGKREKYPSTIYVTIKPLIKPSSFRPRLFSAKTGAMEDVMKDYATFESEMNEMNANIPITGTDGDQSERADQIMGPLERVSHLPPRWQKFPNSKCKIPTEPLATLRAGENGCSAIRFSHNGYFLACAQVNKTQQNSILVYEIPSGQRVLVFAGHLQTIYDLDWSRTDSYLASASADSSVKIWNFKDTQLKAWRSLAHPTYVYCVRFHPSIEDIVVTAGYDKTIRVWSTEKKHGHVIRMMNDHLGYISSISFNVDGTRLASVDSVGSIRVWHGFADERRTKPIHGDNWGLDITLDFAELRNVSLNSVNFSSAENYLLVSGCDNHIMLVDIQTQSISRDYIGSFNLQDRLRATLSSCGSIVFAGSEDGQVNCWHAYNETLLYSYKNLQYTRPVNDLQFHPLDNILAMCSIGPSHQVYVFQHTFSDADIEAKPLPPQQKSKERWAPMTNSGRTTPIVRRDTSRDRYPSASDTEGRSERDRKRTTSDESSLPNASINNSRNRKLAVVEKILNEMDDAIKSKPDTNRYRDSISHYDRGQRSSRSTERDASPYQGRRNPPTSDYNSDAGRPPIVSPLRNLTSPDLFVPVSNRVNDDDDDISGRSTPSLANPIMYASVSYKAQRPEELSFSKNDRIKILKKESYLLWYAEHMSTGARGYVSPNRVYLNAKDTYSSAEKLAGSNAHIESISEIPRLNNSSRRLQQKSVKFDSSD